MKIINSYLNVFINSYVKKFRNYNNDKYLIVITGLKKFLNEDNHFYSILTEQLKEQNFIIEFESATEESINHLNITCKNITKDTDFNLIYQFQYLPSIAELSSKTDIPLVGIVIMKIIAQVICKLKILYKAIVIDLDDSLWPGTLSEVGVDKIKENLQSAQGVPFIAFMKFIKTLADELGIFVAICSRNDSKIVESTLDALDDNVFPLKNHIDCIIANYNDKSDNLIKIAEQLSILPESIVFIDDNQIVRDEIKNALPKVFVPEWSNHYKLITQLIIACIFERVELSLNSQNRRKQFKIIQTERTQNSLPALNIKINFDYQHTESIKLYSKTNQFKFSQNNDEFNKDAKSFYFEIYRKNGENLGICSAVTYSITNDSLHIHNWAISCRYFEIGLEEFILIYIHDIAKNKNVFINYQQTEHNQKVKELLNKYTDSFKMNLKDDKIEILFTKILTDKMCNNTNLSELKI